MFFQILEKLNVKTFKDAIVKIVGQITQVSKTFNIYIPINFELTSHFMLFYH